MEKYAFDVYKAKAGCPVVNGEGRPVNLIDFDYKVPVMDSPYPCIVGKVLYEQYERLRVYRMDGKFLQTDDDPSQDLFLADNDPSFECEKERIIEKEMYDNSDAASEIGILSEVAVFKAPNIRFSNLTVEDLIKRISAISKDARVASRGNGEPHIIYDFFSNTLIF